MADIMVTLQKLANENTAKTFAFNKSEAKTTRSWQEQMSNTAHQREVKDLIKAGLNPVLSAGGSGAQSYSASSASGSADSAVNAIGNVESSRTSAKAMKYSADKSYAAAQAAAAAQRYAAEQSAAATRYAADMNYKTQMEKPQGSPFALIDKYAGNILNAFGKDGVKELKNLIRNPKTVFNSEYVDNNGNFKNTYAIQNMKNPYKVMNSSGVYKVRQFLMSNGYAPTEHNISALIKFMAGKKSEIYDLTPLNTARNSAIVLKNIHDYTKRHSFISYHS